VFGIQNIVTRTRAHMHTLSVLMTPELGTFS
jgi:hypothetical protein